MRPVIAKIRFPSSQLLAWLPHTPEQRQRLLIAGVLLVLVALSLAAGAAAGGGRNLIALLFILGPLALLGAYIVSRWYELLVLAMPVAALATRFEVPTGTSTQLPIVLLLVLGFWSIWIASMLIRGRVNIAYSPLNLPFLVFAIICCISLVWGIIWRDPVVIDAPSFIFVQIASLLTHLVSVGAAVLIGNYMQSEARLKYMVGAFLFFGTLMTLTQVFGIRQNFLNDKGLWGLWTVVPAYGLLIGIPRLRWHWRLLLITLIALNLYQTMIVNAEWVSGWVPTIFGVVAVTFLRSKKAFLVVLLIVLLALYGTRGFFEEVAHSNIEDGSMERLDLWEQNLRVAREHWLFGTGPAGYAIYYMTYYREDARSTHNNYLDVLSQFGLTGMAAWIWIAGAGLLEGWRLHKRAPPGFLKALIAIATGGWFAALVSMMLGDWVLPFAYNQGVGGYKYTVYTWLFLGTLISARHILLRRQLNDDYVIPRR